jgi:hypothetical protein
MGLPGTLFVSLGIILECSWSLGSLQEGDFKGAVDAQLGNNTRVDQALSVLPDPFVGDGVVWLACYEDVVFPSRVNGRVVEAGLGYLSQ